MIQINSIGSSFIPAISTSQTFFQTGGVIISSATVTSIIRCQDEELAEQLLPTRPVWPFAMLFIYQKSDIN